MVLIPLAVALWIVIVLKIISFIKPQPAEDSISLTGRTYQEIDDTTDTISLLLDYPDPFERNISRTSSMGMKPQTITPRFFSNRPELQPPKISYSGVIQTNDTESSVGLLSINGRSVLASTNDTVAGIQVINLWNDSVLVRFDRKTFTVKR